MTSHISSVSDQHFTFNQCMLIKYTYTLLRISIKILNLIYKVNASGSTLSRLLDFSRIILNIFILFLHPWGKSLMISYLINIIISHMSNSLWSSKFFTPVVIVFILCALGAMSVRNIKSKLFCAENVCATVKDYTDACILDRNVFCCGGSLGFQKCGSYSNCVKLPNIYTEYSMCTPLRVTFWILFAIGLLSVYAGIVLAHSFYKGKTGGLLQ